MYLIGTATTICLFFLVAIVNANESNIQNNVPALFYSRNNKLNKELELSIGQPMSEDALRHDVLEQLYTKSIKEVAIVLLNHIDDQNIRFNIPTYKLENQVTYVPSINEGYDKIAEYFHKAGIHIETYQVGDDDVNKYADAFKTFNSLMSKYDAIVLTGMNSAFRAKRAAGEKKSELNQTNSDNHTLIFGPNCAAVFKAINFANFTVENKGNRTQMVVLGTSTFDCPDNQTSTLHLQFQPGTEPEYITSVQLRYTMKARKWLLMANETLAQTNLGKNYTFKFLSLPANSETPPGYSFGCTLTRFQLVNINTTTPSSTGGSVEATPANKALKYYIYIEEFQIQPFYMQPNNTIYKFGQVNYCTGFFTNGIWMGIVSSLVMGIILAIGIKALTSINTMDRFDDPKGKPLVINAEK